jgi:hypothetical protein
LNLGSLFFSLGVKGAEKAKQDVGNVSEGLNKTASNAWAVKAGILGAMYALERFTAAGNARGTGLLNLSTVLGVASQDIERYSWAAQQAGVANQVVGASFEALQRSLTQLKFEGKTNKWFSLFSQFTGVTTGELDRLREHPEQMIQKLQDFYNRAPIDKSLKNEIIDQFGVGALLPAFARNEFRPDVLNRAPVHSTGDVAALDRNRSLLANLHTQFDMTMDRLNVQFGSKIISDISKLTPEVLKLVTAFGNLASKLPILQTMGMVFEGWTDIFKGLDVVVDAFSDPKKMKALQDNIRQFLTSDIPGMLGATPGGEQDIRNVTPSKEGPGYTEPYGLGFKIDKNADTINHSFGPKIGALLDQLDKAMPGGKSMGAFLQELMGPGAADTVPAGTGPAKPSAAPRLPSPAAVAAHRSQAMSLTKAARAKSSSTRPSTSTTRAATPRRSARRPLARSSRLIARTQRLAG